ncbi:hypothetical protein JOS77_07270 [Chromobacterium haemolyticum]|nr:hypothetical protein JOS77_07270 [Chromobacterium haemolyticum]
MTTLRLYLRAGWPDSEPGLPWALLGARGEPSAQGDSAPAGWPRADRCELILPAAALCSPRRGCRPRSSSRRRR